MSSPASLSTNDLLQHFDHLNPQLGADGTPCAYYEALRDEAQTRERFVGWSEVHGGFWAVLGYNEYSDVVRNPAAFSNREPTLPRYGTGESLMIAGQDDPDHRFARALVNSPFGPNGVRIYDDTLRDNVNLLIDGFIAGGSADVAQLVARPIPAILTALLMGLPAELGPKFMRWCRALSEGFIIDPEAAAPDIAEMYEYFEDTIAKRKRDGGQDILSQVINANVDGRSFNHQELLGFCTVLMLGGIDNTKNLLGTILWRLGWDIDLRARLVRDNSLIPKAVQEFLRYHSPAFTAREVREPVTVGGVNMEPGQMVLLCNPIANRDPRAFEYPDSFIATRSPNRHVGLGLGIHRCLGAHLLTLEAQLVIEEFLKRIPNYRIDPARECRWWPGFVSGMGNVPIIFEPGKPQRDVRGNPGVEAWLASAQAA
jgi:cytochrome P450